MKRQIVFSIALVLGILILINFIGVRLFTRIDLTESQMYTLSDASRNLVKSLDDKFLVKAYFTAELPSPYNNNRRYLQDQLDEYRAYGGGNFQYEFIDPGKNPDLEKEAQRYQIPPVQVQVMKEDKFQVEKAYMGLVFLHGDKQERLPVVQSLNNMEYEITSAIKKMTAKESKKIGLLAGHGEPDLQAMNRFRENLEKQYDVITVNLEGGREVPAEVSVLLVIAPNQGFKEWEKYLLDQFVMRGGKVAFFLNKVNMTLQSQQGQALNLNLDDMLESYGVRVNTDLVRDTRCAMVTVSQNAGFFTIQNQVPFFYLPMASTFNPTSPLVKDLGTLVFYFGSSIDTSLAKEKGLTLDVLVKSSEKSGRQEGFFFVDPTAPATEEMFKESHIPLAVTVEGSFKSAFQGKTLEPDSTGPSLNTSGALSVSSPTKIVVVGDGDFMQDQFSGGNKDNIIFASNLVDYLADDIGLASIRSRETGAKPLDEVAEGTRSLVKGINLAVPPLLILLAGVLRWRWRVGMRKRLESQSL